MFVYLKVKSSSKPKRPTLSMMIFCMNILVVLRIFMAILLTLYPMKMVLVSELVGKIYLAMKGHLSLLEGNNLTILLLRGLKMVAVSVLGVTMRVIS